MNKILKRTKMSVIFMGIALLMLGVVLFMNPGNAMLFITIALGWVLVVVGGFMIAAAIMSPLPTLSQGDFVLGLIALVFGVCVVVWPGTFVSFIYLIIGVVVFVTGLNDLASAMDEKKLGLSGWKPSLVIGIITLVLGVLVMLAPFTMAEFVMMIAGVALVFDGVSEIVVGVRMPSN